MTETLVNEYSSESYQRQLFNEYQLDRFKMIFIIFPFFVHWTKVTSAAEGLSITRALPPWPRRLIYFSLNAHSIQQPYKVRGATSGM